MERDNEEYWIECPLNIQPLIGPFCQIAKYGPITDLVPNRMNIHMNDRL